MPLAADLDAFLADFAVAATLVNSAVVRGVFDSAASVAFGMAGSEPSFLAKSSDLAALQYGSQIEIGGKTYTVRAIEPDGTGLTRLILERA